MGIRPKIMTVFGINDYDGPRPPESFWERRIYISDEDIKQNFNLSYVKDYAYDQVRKEWRWYPDIVHFGSCLKKLESIVGLIQSQDFDSDTFRVLCMLYPEFLESGYRKIPLESPAMQKSRLRHQKPVEMGSIEFQPHWFYQQGYYWLTPVWAFVTKWLLDNLGVETDPKNYHWMLVWEWS